MIHTLKRIVRFFLHPPFTRNFRKHLFHNFHTLAWGEMVLYVLFVRPWWSKERRFFFEGSWGLLGQMYSAERQALYEMILNNKPRQCYEIGTFTGGGSTYFLSRAMADIENGTLITSENDPYYYDKATTYYARHLPDQNKRITFVHSGSVTAFDKYIPKDKIVDAVFFDGAEDSTQTLEQYRYFEPYLKPGSVIAFHDWNTEKTSAIKPIITSDKRWDLLLELKPPTSVGLAIFKHR